MREKEVEAGGERLLNAEQVAAKLGVSARSVWKWVAAGKFPRPLRVGDRAVRWRQAAVDDFIARGCKPGGAEYA